MFGSERWWKGDHVQGTMGQANELQLLVNQEARATTGCFRTTNLGALSMESGLRAATTQLENRQRRFRLRLLSLPEGDQAREVVGAPTGIGWRLKNALATADKLRGQCCPRSWRPATQNCCKRRNRGESGSRGDPTGPYNVHRWVTT